MKVTKSRWQKGSDLEEKLTKVNPRLAKVK